MSNTSHSYTRLLTTLVVTCVVAAFTAQPALAQTAKKLKCNGCVKSKQLKNNGIKSTDIKNGQVKNPDLANNAVTGAKIATGAVGASEIATGAVTSSKLANSAKPAAADFAEGEQNLSFPLNADTVVRSVALTAPAPGVVIVNGTVTMFFGAGGGFVACSLTTGLVIVSAALVQQGNAATGTESVALTRGFEVGAGTTTFNLVCKEFSGSVVARDSILTALYVPQRS